MTHTRTLGIGLNALRTESDGPLAKAPGLALNFHKLALAVEDQVISLVHTKRQQSAITAPNELVEYCGLGALPHVNGVVRQNRFRQNRTHVRTLDKTPDADHGRELLDYVLADLA